MNHKKEAEIIFEQMLKVVKKYRTPTPIFSERIQAKFCSLIAIAKVIEAHTENENFIAVTNWIEIKNQIKLL